FLTDLINEFESHRSPADHCRTESGYFDYWDSCASASPPRPSQSRQITSVATKQLTGKQRSRCRNQSELVGAANSQNNRIWGQAHNGRFLEARTRLTKERHERSSARQRAASCDPLTACCREGTSRSARSSKPY